MNCLGSKDRYAHSNRIRAIFQLKLFLGEFIIGHEYVNRRCIIKMTEIFFPLLERLRNNIVIKRKWKRENK